MATLGIVLLSVVLVFGCVLIRNHFSLNTTPGPLLAGLTNLWRVLLQNLPGYGRHLESLHRKYGQVVRVGPSMVSVSDPSLSDWTDLSDQWVVTAPVDNDICIVTRSSVEELQHGERIKQLTITFLRAVRTQRTLNLMVFKLFATDVVQHMCSDDLTHTRNSQVIATEPLIPTDWSFVSSLIDSLLLKCPITMLKHKRNGCLSICGFIPKTTKSPNIYQPGARDCRGAENPSFFATGIECMEATFASVFYFLSRNPEALSRIKREVDVAFSNASVSGVIHQNRSYALPYVDAAMNETLRHVMVFDYQRQVTADGVLLGEYGLPHGTVIQYHVDPIRHNSAIYGEDSVLFRPERWFVADIERRKRMEKGLIPLYLCITHDLQTRAAWSVLKIIVALIVWKFDLQTPCEEVAMADNILAPTPYNTLVTFVPRLP